MMDLGTFLIIYNTTLMKMITMEEVVSIEKLLTNTLKMVKNEIDPLN